jgi:hypothetical protein
LEINESRSQILFGSDADKAQSLATRKEEHAKGISAHFAVSHEARAMKARSRCLIFLM